MVVLEIKNEREKRIWDHGYDKGHKVGLMSAISDMKNLISAYTKVLSLPQKKYIND